MIFAPLDLNDSSSMPLDRKEQENFFDRHQTITAIAFSVLFLAGAIYLFRDTIDRLLVNYRIQHPSPCPLSFCQENPFNAVLKGGCYCPNH